MIQVVLAVASVVLVAVLAVRMAVRGQGMGRVYWGACSLLLWVGIVGLVLIFVFPPEMFDDEGRLIGEMPPAFGVALAVAAVGLAGALAGFAVAGAMRLLRPKAPR